MIMVYHPCTEIHTIWPITRFTDATLGSKILAA